MRWYNRLIDRLCEDEALHGQVQAAMICLLILLISVIMLINNLIVFSDTVFILACSLTLISTLGLLLVLRRNIPLSNAMMSVAVVVIGALFIYNGGGDGFGPLWTILLPNIAVLFFGLKRGTGVSLTMLALMLAMLWTPLHEYLAWDYDPAFRLRIPMVFLGCFFIALTLEFFQFVTRERLNRSRSHLERLSHIDELTQVDNRRSFYERIQDIWRMSARAQRPISMLMVDIDDFKPYNDCYGHLEGDRVLFRVAQAVRGSVSRGSDLVARWGGEEFVVLLPMTSAEGAKVVARRLMDRVAALEIPHKAQRQPNQYLTVSVGIACLQPDPGVDYEQLIHQADISLYEAKHQGRNRVGPLDAIGFQPVPEKTVGV